MLLGVDAGSRIQRAARFVRAEFGKRQVAKS